MPEAVAFLKALSKVTPHGVWDWFIGKPLSVVITIVVALAVRWALIRSIGRIVDQTIAKTEARRSAEPGRARRALAQATGTAHERRRQRTLTMGSLLRSVITLLVLLIALLYVLDIFKVSLAPILASAGVGGVALGFGAQSLVRDFLSGIFMILEDQYGVGDVIDTGTTVGTVEEVTLRVTRLRDGQGVVWYVRNGEIMRIGNKSQGSANATIDIPVSYAENLDRVIPLIREVVHQLDESPEWHDILLEEPQVVGVESITGSAVTIRVVVKTVAEQQYGISREIRERVKAAFDAHGVQAPPISPYGPTGA
ncbi:small conductance mechanosensitive channel [Phycicoccus badiiscoriae]|uniref:Small conductance mechanosensitive channel n=1 Tax=Pedococcus badiiscoriae TaxID=642776 RepID=A0A852WG95_9MICO|nr:mechanosensitive ion channel family protein [Pedococcus badiiscoriae]NYG08008.1 small conductance mechanosensitive channel [Pedococcus badiiscoriae]